MGSEPVARFLELLELLVGQLRPLLGADDGRLASVAAVGPGTCTVKKRFC